MPSPTTPLRHFVRATTCTFWLLAAFACGTPTAPDNSSVGLYDALWRRFDREYSYFDYKRINWDSLGRAHRIRAESASTPDELVAVVKELLAPLRDVHVRFTAPDGRMVRTYTPTTSPNWDRSIWQRTVTTCGWTQLKPNLGWCSMGDVLYVGIGGWNPNQFEVADLDTLMAQLPAARAMIVDVRMNGGGSDRLAYAFAAHFATQSTVVGFVRFRDGARHSDFGRETTRRIEPRGSRPFTGPVVVLSGRGVYSSNESFIAAMREFPNVTIVGDTTGGATANPAVHDLGFGWKYSVSRWIEWTADRHVIEWQGIPPDEFVAWDAAAVALGRDPVLEVALAKLGVSR